MTYAPLPLSQRERDHVVVAALTAMFPAALDQMMVTPALPTISAEIGGGVWLSWIVSAYFLASTAFTPLLGKVADLKGRRVVLYASLAIFMAASVVCAISTTMPTLIVGRVFQGIGGAGMIAAVQTIIGDVAPPKERARYMAYVSTLWAVASVAGPVSGGILSQYTHWSMIFWINLPLGLIACILCTRQLGKLPSVRRNHRLDLAGAALVVIATSLLLIGLTLGGSVYPWSSPIILLLLGGAVVGFAAFVWQQTLPEEPLLPPRLLSNPVVRNACAAGFFSMTCLMGLSVYIPIYLQTFEGMTPSVSGLALMVLMVGGVSGSAVSGYFLHRTQHYRRVAVIGAVITVLSLVSLGLSVGLMPFIGLEVMVGLAGFGFGTIFPVALLSVQNAAEHRDLGIASATLGFLRNLGAVFGLAALGAIAGSYAITGGAPARRAP